jgi:hypothetical protein
MFDARARGEVGVSQRQPPTMNLLDPFDVILVAGNSPIARLGRTIRPTSCQLMTYVRLTPQIVHIFELLPRFTFRAATFDYDTDHAPFLEQIHKARSTIGDPRSSRSYLRTVLDSMFNSY